MTGYGRSLKVFECPSSLLEGHFFTLQFINRKN